MGSGFFGLDTTGHFQITADNVVRLLNRQNHNKEKFWVELLKNQFAGA
jgi:hypothetical protein